MKKIRIAIIDDHDLFREGLNLVLNQIDGFEVVFCSDNALLLLDFINNEMPDVVLMDIEMSIMDGYQATEIALKKCPTIKIIALTMFSDVDSFHRMIKSGAKGFISKNSGKPELYQAITTVLNGGTYFSQGMLQKIAFEKPLEQTKQLLTDRELEILRFICDGKTSQEIARDAFISVKTVEVHRSNIFSKTNVRNVAELIVWAIKNNLYLIKNN